MAGWFDNWLILSLTWGHSSSPALWVDWQRLTCYGQLTRNFDLHDCRFPVPTCLCFWPSLSLSLYLSLDLSLSIPLPISLSFSICLFRSVCQSVSLSLSRHCSLLFSSLLPSCHTLELHYKMLFPNANSAIMHSRHGSQNSSILTSRPSFIIISTANFDRW